MSDYVIGVVGNPNCGKTTLFNALTGAKQRVGNWPGTTVDRKSGEYTHANKRVEVVDLPGIYSLSATSLDEEVARDYILSGEADLIVNIVDASNLERNLYLTVQLLEMQVPLVLALNMRDAAKDRRIEIDIPMLSHRLGCPVVPLVASQGKGMDALRMEINRCAQEKSVSNLKVVYPAEIQEAVDALVPLVRDVVVQRLFHKGRGHGRRKQRGRGGIGRCLQPFRGPGGLSPGLGSGRRELPGDPDHYHQRLQ